VGLVIKDVVDGSVAGEEPFSVEVAENTSDQHQSTLRDVKPPLSQRFVGLRESPRRICGYVRFAVAFDGRMATLAVRC
jgi:hypothetical protein